jgi:diadenosine tetraphosphate (Ap4A) HIT family hydrolase
MIANIGDDSGSEVPHLHIHVCGGRNLGRMIPKA